ncbi:MAG: inositol monophosphatase [Elusimicrobia bacterium]|nr:inositol monophosphatase [Elusimicrobiota bacterium]
MLATGGASIKGSTDLKLLGLRWAKEAALKAGWYLARRNFKSTAIASVLNRDLKLKADMTCERIISGFLREKSPWRILGEEQGWYSTATGGGPGDYYWIVDPLDGSVNYARGIPLGAVSIALWKKKSPVLGAIYDFNNKEMFSGCVGLGAWLNAVSVSVSGNNQPDRSVICTGLPAAGEFSHSAIEKWSGALSQFQKARLLGSAALSLCYVACGRADVYWERDIKIWDVAAGLAIVKAAGGNIRWASSDSLYSLNVAAGNHGLTRLLIV